MVEPEAGEAAVLLALSGSDWRVGYCRGGAQRGAYLLAWPLGDGLWDIVFNPESTFDGTSGEDVYLISLEDQAAVKELARADIEWAPDLEIAVTVALELFPDTRAARFGRKAGRERTANSRQTTETHRAAVDAADPWLHWRRIFGNH